MTQAQGTIGEHYDDVLVWLCPLCRAVQSVFLAPTDPQPWFLTPFLGEYIGEAHNTCWEIALAR